MKTQQHEVYASEWSVDQGRSFDTIEDVSRWVNALRDQWWWSRFFPTVRFIEFDKATKISAGGWFPDEGIGVIELLPSQMTEHIILHEVSHVLAGARYDSKSHDPFYARTLLELTYLVRGSEAWQALHNAFERDGIVIDQTPEDNRLHGIAL